MATLEQKQNARAIFQKGVQAVLEEAKVPMKYHLKVVEALHKAVADHTKDRKDFRKAIEGTNELLRNRSDEFETHKKGFQQEITRVQQVKQGEKGDPGKDGEDAQPVDVHTVISAVLAQIPLPERGEKGDRGADASFDEQAVIERLIKRLQKGDVLHINHVKGAGGFIKDGIKYRFEELMHGGGSKSTGSSGYQVPTSGAVNGSNQVFVWTTAPNVIVVDQGRPMQKVSSDGTINWTGTTTTTLAVAPNYDIFATN